MVIKSQNTLAPVCETAEEPTGFQVNRARCRYTNSTQECLRLLPTTAKREKLWCYLHQPVLRSQWMLHIKIVTKNKKELPDWKYLEGSSIHGCGPPSNMMSLDEPNDTTATSAGSKAWNMTTCDIMWDMISNVWPVISCKLN